MKRMAQESLSLHYELVECYFGPTSGSARDIFHKICGFIRKCPRPLRAMPVNKLCNCANVIRSTSTGSRMRNTVCIKKQEIFSRWYFSSRAKLNGFCTVCLFQFRSTTTELLLLCTYSPPPSFFAPKVNSEYSSCVWTFLSRPAGVR